MTLSKAQILEASDLPKELVDVPEWGGQVWIRALTAAERDEYEQSVLETHGTGRHMEIRPNLSNAKAKLVARCVVDDDGNRLFTSAKDIVELGGKSANVLNRLYEVAQRLSGISEKDIEELEKNSEAAQPASLVTD